VRRSVWLILILALSLPALGGCGLPEQPPPSPFDTLAHWVPASATQVLFLDLKLSGEAGRRWERIRQRIEENEEAREILRELLSQFRVDEYALDEVIDGPAVSGYWEGVEYAVFQVSDEEAARDALLRRSGEAVWEEEFAGKVLRYGRGPASYQQRDRLAWMVFDGLLFLCFSHTYDPLPKLEGLAGLTEEDSLSDLPSWQTLRTRLPDAFMGLAFFNAAEQARQNPPAPDDTSPGAALTQQIEAVALAAVPEQDGMRFDVVGAFASEAKDVPELQPLFDLPAADPSAWPGLPADTAIALVAHDASLVWPWLKDIFSLDPRSLDRVQAAVGLDLEGDLLGTDGPLTGDFALAITPPLSDQPVIAGLTAAQLLILAHGATEAQADGVRAAMEGRGAVFGLGEAEGVALQTQVGTASTGYAISYGFDDNLFLLGSSPAVIGQGIATQREGQGLIETEAWRVAMAALRDKPTFVVHLQSASLIGLVQANTTKENQSLGGVQFLEPFEAVSLGLRLQPDRLDGILYFFLAD
jgi:hypothetical protein